MATTNKIIILKDKDGNSLYPKILQNSIPAEAVTKAKLAKEVTDILNSVATDANLKSLKNDVDILKGGATVSGSVDQKVKAAIDNLVGTAPDTLNTLQKIAQELTDPSKNTAATVLDQVASKADSSALAAEVNRAKVAESTNTSKITANTTAITNEVTRAKAAEKANSDAIAAEVTRAKAAEKTNSDAIAAINAKLLIPMLTYEEVTE